MASKLQDKTAVSTFDRVRDWLYVLRSDGNSPETFDDHKIAVADMDFGTIYDFGGNLATPPDALAVFAWAVIGRDCTIPADFSDGDRDVAQAAKLPGGVNPDATFEIAIYADAVQIGTVSLSSGGVATWETTGNLAIDLDAGDVVSFVAPDQGSAQDVSIAGWSFVICARVRAPGT